MQDAFYVLVRTVNSATEAKLRCNMRTVEHQGRTKRRARVMAYMLTQPGNGKSLHEARSSGYGDD